MMSKGFFVTGTKRRGSIFLAGCILSLALLFAGCSETSENMLSSSTPPVPSNEASSSSVIKAPAISSPAASKSTSLAADSEPKSPDPLQKELETPLKNVLTAEDRQEILFQLNGSPAAQGLYDQLPLSVQIENYGSNEKIFYPPDKLDTIDTPIAEGPPGTLNYYAPWGNIAIFYSDLSDGGSDLYELGEAISGVEHIAGLNGEIQIEKVMDDEPLEPDNSQSKPQQSSPSGNVPSREPSQETQERDEMKLKVQVGGQTFTATLTENAAVDAFVEMMQEAPVVIQMEDYSGFEKVGPLGTSLPTNNSQTTTQAGDIVLYTGNQIVMFYGSNSWSYTRLARIDDRTGWEEALGSGDVTVRLSL